MVISHSLVMLETRTGPFYFSRYKSRFNGVRDRIRVFVYVDNAIGIFRRKIRSIGVESARKNLVGFYECFRVFHSIISAIKVVVHILYNTLKYFDYTGNSILKFRNFQTVDKSSTDDYMLSGRAFAFVENKRVTCNAL